MFSLFSRLRYSHDERIESAEEVRVFCLVYHKHNYKWFSCYILHCYRYMNKPIINMICKISWVLIRLFLFKIPIIMLDAKLWYKQPNLFGNYYDTIISHPQWTFWVVNHTIMTDKTQPLLPVFHMNYLHVSLLLLPYGSKAKMLFNKILKTDRYKN